MKNECNQSEETVGYGLDHKIEVSSDRVEQKWFYEKIPETLKKNLIVPLHIPTPKTIAHIRS